MMWQLFGYRSLAVSFGLLALPFAGAARPCSGDESGDRCAPAAKSPTPMPPATNEARLLILARKPRQAADCLRSRLAETPRGDERSILRWYLTLAENAANVSNGGRPARLHVSFTRTDRDSDSYFRLLAHGAGHEGFAPPWWTLLGWPLAAIGSTVPSGGASLAEVADFFIRAKKDCDADPSIENKIRLSTWSLLFAELAAEDPALGIWTTALDAFELGSDTLAEIDADIDQDPSIEERISMAPELAMRLDAARVRQPQIEKRQRLARGQERQRLEQLRRIVHAYRDATHEFALFNIYSIEGNQDAAQASTLIAMKSLAVIGEIVSERNDAHLFDDEPGTDQTANLSALTAPPEPFSADTISLIKGFQSLADYYLAHSGGKTNVDLLRRARAWAKAALGDDPALELPSAPSGADPSSPLGHYALALACEALGRAKLAPAPASTKARQDAEDDFSEARAHLARALELIAAKENGGAARSAFVQKLQTANERLRKPAVFLAAADRLMQQGEPRAAWELLREAQERNADGAVWLARADFGRRARIDHEQLLAEFDDAVKSTIVDGSSPMTVLTRAKLMLDHVWRGLGADDAVGVEAGKLKAEASSAVATLRVARASASDDARMTAQLDAYLGIALAYQTILARTTDDAIAAEAYRLARDASAALAILLGKEDSPAEQVKLREALVASRLAQGHLALAILPDYRDEPLLAFSAAFDEAAKLPFAQADVKALGSPLLGAISRRPGEAGNILGREERHRREMMTRFVEAAFTLEFGSAAAAVNQMGQAVDGYDAADAGNESEPDAARLLAEADGVDSKIALTESMRAFKALASVAAGHADAALADIVRAIVPNSTINAGNAIDGPIIELATNRVQSPLSSYALALALESTLDSMSPRDAEAILARSRQAQLGQRRTTELLKSLRLAARYPHLVELTAQMDRRLSSPAYFSERAAKLRQRGDVDGALSELRSGLRRHPASADLWQAYANARLAGLKREKRDADFDDLLAEIDAAAASGLVPEFQRQVIRGAVHEEQRNERPALDAYLKAMRAAADGEQRIFAQSKASALRARLAVTR